MNGINEDMDKLKRLLKADAFLGRGWSFPPTLTNSGVVMAAYEEDIEQSLKVLFGTSPGERVNRYDYGCPLRRYAFEPITTATMVQMRSDITRAVILFEPRITLENISFEQRALEDVLLIRLTYTIIRTNNRSNMVYPFYLNEGTNIEI